MLRHGFACGVDLEDRFTALKVRGFDGDLAVETAGAQQSRVEDIRAVGCGDEDDVRALIEAVHLNEKLVEGLFALVVASADARASVTADRVDLVNEDDRRRCFLRTFEKITHA